MLLLGKEPHSEQDRARLGIPRSTGALAPELQKSLIHSFDAAVTAPAGAAEELTALPLAPHSVPLRLAAAPDSSGRQGGNSKRRQSAHAKPPHTHGRIRCSQQPSRRGEGMRSLPFITIPKPESDFQRAFGKVSVYWRKQQRGCQVQKWTKCGMTKI